MKEKNDEKMKNDSLIREFVLIYEFVDTGTKVSIRSFWYRLL